MLRAIEKFLEFEEAVISRMFPKLGEMKVGLKHSAFKVQPSVKIANDIYGMCQVQSPSFYMFVTKIVKLPSYTYTHVNAHIHTCMNKHIQTYLHTYWVLS